LSLTLAHKEQNASFSLRRRRSVLRSVPLYSSLLTLRLALLRKPQGLLYAAPSAVRLIQSLGLG